MFPVILKNLVLDNFFFILIFNNILKISVSAWFISMLLCSTCQLHKTQNYSYLNSMEF